MVVLIILIPSVSPTRAKPGFVFTHFNTQTSHGIENKAYLFLLGFLTSQYTLTGFDASAHLVTKLTTLLHRKIVNAFSKPYISEL